MCTNINLKVWNKLHGPMHYKIGVTCVFNGHVNLILFEKPEIEFVVNWTHLAQLRRNSLAKIKAWSNV